MSNKTKKKARKIVKRTAKAIQKLGASVGPVLAGVAAGLAARDVAGSGNSYLEDVGRDLAQLVKTLGGRAAAVVHPRSDETSNGQASEHAA